MAMVMVMAMAMTMEMEMEMGMGMSQCDYIQLTCCVGAECGPYTRSNGLPSGPVTLPRCADVTKLM